MDGSYLLSRIRERLDMTSYELPDPKEKPLAALVLSYKTWKGVQFDDRSWDRANWSRASRSAETLLDMCGGFDVAERCLSSTAQQFIEARLTWTLETVTRHAHDWMQKNARGASGLDARKRLFDAIAKRRADERAAPQRDTFVAGGEVLASLRDHGAVPSPEEEHHGGSGNGDAGLLEDVDGKSRQRQPRHRIDDAGKDS